MVIVDHPQAKAALTGSKAAPWQRLFEIAKLTGGFGSFAVVRGYFSLMSAFGCNAVTKDAYVLHIQKKPPGSSPSRLEDRLWECETCRVNFAGFASHANFTQ